MKTRVHPTYAPEMHVPCPGEAPRHDRRCGCTCFIIPEYVLERFAKDKKLTAEQRQYFIDAAKLERDWRRARAATANLAKRARSILPTAVTAVAAAAPPSILVFDCQHGTTLPGAPVPNPGASTDDSARRAFDETTAVV